MGYFVSRQFGTFLGETGSAAILVRRRRRSKPNCLSGFRKQRPSASLSITPVPYKNEDRYGFVYKNAT